MATEGLRVEVRRSGGLAGVTRARVIEAAPEDSPDSVEALRELVAAADRAGWAPGPAGGVADRYQYDVTILEGASRRSFSVQESGLTEAQRRLVRWVMAEGADIR